ncbi:MAG TPA: PsbP-related protein, partial [Candidatus Bathyarchaeia archaeon]|nr:PsbP-related protein [Candidatus Bathyarchaeia archaeon]
KKQAAKNPYQQKAPSTPKRPEWDTYKNKDRGFNFRYPTDWLFSIIFDTPEMFAIELRKEDFTQEKVLVYEAEMTPSYQIGISIENNPDGLTAKEYRLKQFGEGSRKEEEANLKEVEEDGVKGVRFSEGAAPSSGLATMVIFSHKDKFYKFTYMAMAYQETHEKYLEVFDKILNSLEFD